MQVGMVIRESSYPILKVGEVTKEDWTLASLYSKKPCGTHTCLSYCRPNRAALWNFLQGGIRIVLCTLKIRCSPLPIKCALVHSYIQSYSGSSNFGGKQIWRRKGFTVQRPVVWESAPCARLYFKQLFSNSVRTTKFVLFASDVPTVSICPFGDQSCNCSYHCKAKLFQHVALHKPGSKQSPPTFYNSVV